MSEHDDLADCLALVQAVEALVDLGKRQAPAHQAIDRQATAPIELDVARQIAGRHAGPDIAALHRALLGDEVDERQWQRRRRWWQAGGDRGAAAARDLV